MLSLHNSTRTYIVMNPILLDNHTLAHIEAMKKDTSRSQCQLRQLEQYPRREDEIHALGPPTTFLQRCNPFQPGRTTDDLGGGE